ncbi:MAG: protein-disulfide isomerase [Syntrophus sp. (in: bacteria)]|nr:protein-disulfide isomerase [Syntrophus sp. (in: bacteria)]
MDLRKKAAVVGITLIIMTGTSLGAATPEETFRKNFPNIRLDSITPTAVTGLYEIVSEGRVAYYAPGPEYLITGSLITREGRNLTEERAEKIKARNLKETPLEKALKIGGGPHTVIEITDPDCSYCRKASAFLSSRNDVTRHVFFFPLSIHPNAEAKIRYIFCATDRARAYEEAMAGKLDDMKFKPCDDAAAAELVKAHKEIGARIGVTGTPLFLIDGQVIDGADIPRMEKILDSKVK